MKGSIENVSVRPNRWEDIRNTIWKFLKKYTFYLLLVIFFFVVTALVFIFVSKSLTFKHTVSRRELFSVDRVSHLQRGVDISLWFRFPMEENDNYYTNYITDDDINFIKNSGFTHVRLSIAPQYIFDSSSATEINSYMFPFIDKAITKLLAHNLAVIIDIHDEQKTFENSANAENFVIFWKNFAKHLTKFNSNSVYFELLNEPIFEDKEEEWLTLQGKLIHAVREQAPDNTIIATGANWGGIEGLQKVNPYDDRNIIYSFHYYEPSAFTHQGADWAGDAYPSIANLAYPYNQANCEHVLNTVRTDNARDLVQDYCNKKWNKATIANLVQQAVEWSKTNGVPIWVGEFGVYCKQAPRQSKLQWLKDVKGIFEQNHIGWTLWAYDDCFGLGVTKQNGHITYDADVLQIFKTVR